MLKVVMGQLRGIEIYSPTKTTTGVVDHLDSRAYILGKEVVAGLIILHG